MHRWGGGLDSAPKLPLHNHQNTTLCATVAADYIQYHIYSSGLVKNMFISLRRTGQKSVLFLRAREKGSNLLECLVGWGWGLEPDGEVRLSVGLWREAARRTAKARGRIQSWMHSIHSFACVGWWLPVLLLLLTTLQHLGFFLGVCVCPPRPPLRYTTGPASNQSLLKEWDRETHRERKKANPQTTFLAMCGDEEITLFWNQRFFTPKHYVGAFTFRCYWEIMMWNTFPFLSMPCEVWWVGR